MLSRCGSHSCARARPSQRRGVVGVESTEVPFGWRLGFGSPDLRGVSEVGDGYMGDMSKVFVTRDGVLYVQEDGGEPRPARLGERFTYVLEHSHRRLWPYGRQ